MGESSAACRPCRAGINFFPFLSSLCVVRLYVVCFVDLLINSRHSLLCYPAGRYGAEGDVNTNQSCSGPCSAGYWCAEGSFDPQANECGSNAFYCPENSETPTLVSLGHYSVGGISNQTHTSQEVCNVGFSCVGGIQQPCRPGSFATQEGSVECTALEQGYYVDVTDDSIKECESGHYCQNGLKYECGGSNFFCPNNGMVSVDVVTVGFYSIGGNSNTTRTGQQICEPGYFCLSGIRVMCPSGTFSPSPGSSTCTGVSTGVYLVDASTGETAACEPGFYCQEGIKQECSAGEYADEPNSVYCKLADRGYFTESPLNQTECPAGTYSSKPGSTFCSPCEEGSVAGRGLPYCIKCSDDGLVPDLETQTCKPLEEQETAAGLLIGSSTFIVVVLTVLFVWNYKKYPRSAPSVLPLLGVAVIDFISDILFIYSLSSAVGRLSNLRSASIAFLILPMIVNAAYTIQFVKKQRRDTEAFVVWLKKYQLPSGLMMVLGSLNLELLTLMDSKLFHHGAFSAPISEIVHFRLQSLGIVSNLMEDLPQLSFKASLWLQALQT